MSSPKILRTPDSQFENLAKFPFKPHYIDDLKSALGARIHYLDERNGVRSKHPEEVFLCLHGEPTWSYLYRKMIPVFLAQPDRAVRVIVPDMIGFGRSDKFGDIDNYSFHLHRNVLIELVERLNVTNITLVCQDWGGLLGLTLPMSLEPRFSRAIVMNTNLATGMKQLGKGFYAWRAYCNATPDMDVGGLIATQTPSLTDAEKRAYDAPFPDASFKAGVRSFPNLVCDRPDAPGADTSRAAVEWWRQHRLPVFMAIGLRDRVIPKPAMLDLAMVFGGGCEIMELEEAGHFVQEWGDKVAQSALKGFKYLKHKEHRAGDLLYDKQQPNRTAKL